MNVTAILCIFLLFSLAPEKQETMFPISSHVHLVLLEWFHFHLTESWFKIEVFTSIIIHSSDIVKTRQKCGPPPEVREGPMSSRASS